MKTWLLKIPLYTTTFGLNTRDTYRRSPYRETVRPWTSSAMPKLQDRTGWNWTTIDGPTEPPFKLRYRNHLQPLRHEKHQNSTELSKYIWHQKWNNTHSLSIGQFPTDPRPTAANERGAVCVCVTEKLSIINVNKTHSPEQTSKLFLDA